LLPPTGQESDNTDVSSNQQKLTWQLSVEFVFSSAGLPVEVGSLIALLAQFLSFAQSLRNHD